MAWGREDVTIDRGGKTTVIENMPTAVDEVLSVADTMKEYVLAVVGTPYIVPFVASDSPGGNTPPVNAHVHGVLATSVVEYDVFTVPFGSGPERITGAASTRELAIKGREILHSMMNITTHDISLSIFCCQRCIKIGFISMTLLNTKSYYYCGVTICQSNRED